VRGRLVFPTASFFEYLIYAEEGIEKWITSESQGVLFEVEAVGMKSNSGEKIGLEDPCQTCPRLINSINVLILRFTCKFKHLINKLYSIHKIFN
jgi:hypothetical protein